MTALPLRDFTDAERDRLAAIEAAPAAPESYHLQPALLRLMDLLEVTPYIERLAARLARLMPERWR